MKSEPTVTKTGDDAGNRAAELAAEMHRKRAEMIDFRRARSGDRATARAEARRRSR